MNRILLVFTALLAGNSGSAQPQPPAPPRPPRVRVSVNSTPTSFLGVGVTDIDTERAKALKLKEEHGVEVTSVDDDSPAAKAGVKVGDVALEYNGQRVEGIGCGKGRPESRRRDHQDRWSQGDQAQRYFECSAVLVIDQSGPGYDRERPERIECQRHHRREVLGNDPENDRKLGSIVRRPG